MTDEEVAALLATGRTLQVATIGPDGAPHLVAMWYVVLDGRLAFWTYAKSQKARNLVRDPRITCLVEAGQAYQELRGVMVRGFGRVSDDFETVCRVGALVFEKYQGPLTEAAQTVIEQQGRKRVAVVVEAEQVVSWDHGK